MSICQNKYPPCLRKADHSGYCLTHQPKPLKGTAEKQKAELITKAMLIKRIDQKFSILRRTETSFDGKCRCVTCGIVKPINEMQAGHFVSRGYFHLRWDRRNVHPQCAPCNCHKDKIQMEKEYEEFLRLEIGSCEVDWMLESKKEFNKEPSLAELKEILLSFGANDDNLQ